MDGGKWAKASGGVVGAVAFVAAICQIYNTFFPSSPSPVMTSSAGGQVSAPKSAPAAEQPVTPEANPLCAETADAREQPIRALFTAWVNLDSTKYGEQWTADAVQYYGHGRTRKLQQIISDRAEMMAKLQSVTVDEVQLTPLQHDGSMALYRASYAMRFFYTSGRVLPDSNVENYTVVCDPQSRLWKIKTNSDSK